MEVSWKGLEEQEWLWATLTLEKTYNVKGLLWSRAGQQLNLREDHFVNEFQWEKRATAEGRKNRKQLAHPMEGPQGNTCVNPFAQLARTLENFVTWLHLQEHDFTSDGSVDLPYQFLGLGDSWELNSLKRELTGCQAFPSLHGLPSSCCNLFLNIRRA